MLERKTVNSHKAGASGNIRAIELKIPFLLANAICYSLITSQLIPMLLKITMAKLHSPLSFPGPLLMQAQLKIGRTPSK